MSVFADHIGLNITEEKLQLVEIIYKESEFVVESIEEEYFEEVLSQDIKETKFIHILQNAYNEIVLRNFINTDKVSISLPLNYFKTFELPVDKNLIQSDLNEYVEWEFVQLFPHLNKDEYAFQPITSNEEDDSESLRTFVYCIPKSILKILHKFCVRNNLLLLNVDNSHIAATTFLQLGKSTKEQLSIYIDSLKVSAILFKENQFVFQKQIKYKVISDIPIVVKQIYDEIIKRNLISSSLSNFFVSGNTLSKELINKLENDLNLKAKSILPFEKISVSQKITKEEYLNDNAAKFSSATGMAIRLVS